MMTIKSIRTLLYLNSLLLIIVSLLPYVIKNIYPDTPYVEIIAISAGGMTLVMIFYFIILAQLSTIARGIVSPAESLARKMMSCKFRIEHGLDYCVKCPDGYDCASGKK